MNRLMQWYLTRRALKLLRAGWEIGDKYGSQVMTYTYRPRKYTKAGTGGLT